MGKKYRFKEKGSAFRNQKQLRYGGRVSGSQWVDNRIDINDTENNLEKRREFSESPFMHPMHDATADPQLDGKE